MARVRKTVKLDPDVRNLSRDALALIAKVLVIGVLRMLLMLCNRHAELMPTTLYTSACTGN